LSAKGSVTELFLRSTGAGESAGDVEETLGRFMSLGTSVKKMAPGPSVRLGKDRGREREREMERDGGGKTWLRSH